MERCEINVVEDNGSDVKLMVVTNDIIKSCED